MSYTNINLVKKHFSPSSVPGGIRRDYPVIFAGLEEIELPGQSIITGSVIVKAAAGFEPTMEEVNLGDSAVTLAHDRLVPDSMTVASDSSLGTVYVENADYSVDSANGTIIRRAGGNINDGAQVIIWYYYYSQYSEGIDFTIGYQYGTIRRLTGGSIKIGQTVLVDYRLSQSQLNDDIVIEAVNQANAIVEKEIDPERTFGADLTLQAAATYLAVSLLCRIEVSGNLHYAESGRREAQSWLALADSYRADYEKLIRKFRPASARLNHPTRS